MKLRTLLLAACLLPFPLHAQGLNYSYLQGSYEVWTDPDTHEWVIKGSYEFADSFYAFLEDASGGRHAGVGYYHPLRVDLHPYAQFGLADSRDGFRPVLEGGVRWMLDRQWEMRGLARFITDGHIDQRGREDDELIFAAEGVYNLNRTAALVAALGVPMAADGLVLQFGGRLNF